MYLDIKIQMSLHHDGFPPSRLPDFHRCGGECPAGMGLLRAPRQREFLEVFNIYHDLGLPVTVALHAMRTLAA